MAKAKKISSRELASIEETISTKKIKPLSTALSMAAAGERGLKRIMSDAEVMALYGTPGNSANFTQILAPFPMIVAWDKTIQVQKLTCHKMIATPLSNVLADLLAAYGKQKLHDLGIDL